MDSLSSRVGSLRRQKHDLDAAVRRLEATGANLERLLDARADPALHQRLEVVQRELETSRTELERVSDELEDAEETARARAESIDELEQLVDSFAAVAQRSPELATVLNAMRLMVGSLATARRLEQAHPQLTEPPELVRSLTTALMLLAETLSRAGSQETLRER